MSGIWILQLQQAGGQRYCILWCIIFNSDHILPVYNQFKKPSDNLVDYSKICLEGSCHYYTS